MNFIQRTNDEYAAWCKTYYQPESLDRQGMMSLHGLWAWQEQERRMTAAVDAEARRWASRVETLTAKVQATDERCTQLLTSMAGARAMQPAPTLTLTCPNGNRSDCALFGAGMPGMSPMNRTIAYCAADTLRKLGYEWDGTAWVVRP